MMTLLPSTMSRRRSAEVSACPTVEFTWVNCLTVWLIWLSSTTRSVTMMVEPNTVSPSFWTPMSCRVSQAMELDLPLPAECWMRYRRPAPWVETSERIRRTTSSWWYRARPAFPAPAGRSSR